MKIHAKVNTVNDNEASLGLNHETGAHPSINCIYLNKVSNLGVGGVPYDF